MCQRVGIGVNAPDRAHKPLKEIDRVDRLVHQDASAVKSPGTPPGAAVVVCLRAPPRYDDVAEHQSSKSLFLKQVVHLKAGGIEALLAYVSKRDMVFLLAMPH